MAVLDGRWTCDCEQIYLINTMECYRDNTQLLMECFDCIQHLTYWTRCWRSTLTNESLWNKLSHILIWSSTMILQMRSAGHWTVTVLVCIHCCIQFFYASGCMLLSTRAFSRSHFRRFNYRRLRDNQLTWVNVEMVVYIYMCVCCYVCVHACVFSR